MIDKIQQDGGWILYRPKVNPSKCRPETPEHIDFVAWLRFNYPDEVFYHIPNEGEQSPQYRQQLYKMGLLKGASDLVFIGRPGAVIEMKQCKWSAKPSKEQVDFLVSSAGAGMFSAVCNGAEAAKTAFMDYKSRN